MPGEIATCYGTFRPRLHVCDFRRFYLKTKIFLSFSRHYVKVHSVISWEPWKTNKTKNARAELLEAWLALTIG